MNPSINQEMVQSGWDDVLAWLPDDLNEIAASSGAMQRRRGIRSAGDLVRIALAYSVLDLSLRSVAAWMSTHGLGDVSDVAVLQRLRNAPDLLATIFTRLLDGQMWSPPKLPLKYRIRLVDATTLSAPGSDGADWRLHVGYDAARGVVDRVVVTDEKGGEHLDRIEPGPGEVIVGDRGYAHAERILAACTAGAHVVVRVGHSAVPLVTADGAAFDPVAFAQRKRGKAGRPPRVEHADVWLRIDEARAHPMRLVVVRKSAESTERERTRAKREASRKGKRPTARTMSAAQYTFLLTSLARTDAAPETVAELYRVRWQIELNFKRWKSILGMDQLRARDPDLARTYIFAKLIAAVLADKTARAARAFSPWGVPLEPEHVAGVGLGARGRRRSGDGNRAAQEIVRPHR